MMTTYQITISTDHTDGAAIVRKATEKIACELDWGDDRTTSIETVEFMDGLLPKYLCGYEMEPRISKDGA